MKKRFTGVKSGEGLLQKSLTNVICLLSEGLLQKMSCRKDWKRQMPNA